MMTPSPLSIQPPITLRDVKRDRRAMTYIQKADDALKAIGYTEHGLAHVGLAADRAAQVLQSVGCSERVIELGKIAAYLHDIGNLVNRNDHAHTGAIMAGDILEEMGMDYSEVADVMSAIGNHDEHTGTPISPMAAALIIGDKTDVRRNRVRYPLQRSNDIHDRVNGAVTKTDFQIQSEQQLITLELEVDTAQSDVMEYFQIFLTRMQMCQKAARFLGLKFRLIINDTVMLG